MWSRRCCRAATVPHDLARRPGCDDDAERHSCLAASGAGVTIIVGGPPGGGTILAWLSANDKPPRGYHDLNAVTYGRGIRVGEMPADCSEYGFRTPRMIRQLRARIESTGEDRGRGRRARWRGSAESTDRLRDGASHASVTTTGYHSEVGILMEDGSSEEELIDRLRRGDEVAFVWLLDTYSAALMRLAGVFVSAHSVAEEVVQDTWLAVLTGIARFEGRSSLKTWLFRILVNRAKTRAVLEKRTITFSEIEAGNEADERAVEPRRFLPTNHPSFPGHWASPPYPWSSLVEDAVVSREAIAVLRRGLERLPPAQRAVVALRDVHGWPAADVCAALEVSEANQRVLLHRGRSRLRALLERHLANAIGTASAGVQASKREAGLGD